MNPIEQQTRDWLEQVVIGLNLCPFAGSPYRAGLVRIVINDAPTDDQLLNDLRTELARLQQTSPLELETTLIVVTKLLSNFDDYNLFLEEVDFILRRGQWVGTFQVATFHPQYRFHGTDADDPGNLTNRSPWPILHLLREASIDRAVAGDLDTDAIPDRNIERMNSLTADEKRTYFPWVTDSEG